MTLTFPDNPVLNQEYQAENGLTYYWDGEKWSSQGSYNIDQDNYIRKDGSNTVVYADNLGMGVGTTSPSKNVHVFGTGGILIEDSSESAPSPEVEIIGKRSDANSSPSFSGKLLLAGNSTTNAVHSGKAIGSVLFGGNHTDGTAANILYSASIGAIAEGDYTNATTMPTALAFYTGSTGQSSDTPNVRFGTEVMRISSGGNVGIVKGDPAYPLDIGGQHARIGNGTTTGIIQYGSNSTATNNFHLGAASGSFRLWNGDIGTGTEILRISNSGGVSWDGGSNFLDDYEEGQFTPSYSNATTTNHARQYGRYTKIGNQITCWIWLRLNGFTAPGTSWVHISGLPYTIQNIDIASGMAYIGSAAGFNSYPTSGFGFKNTNEFYLRKEQAPFTWSEMISASNKCDLHCVFQYYVS